MKGREGRKGVRYDMALDSLFLFFIFYFLQVG